MKAELFSLVVAKYEQWKFFNKQKDNCWSLVQFGKSILATHNNGYEVVLPVVENHIKDT